MNRSFPYLKKELHVLIVAFGVASFIIGGVMSCDGTTSVKLIVVEGPTKVLAKPECSSSEREKVIAVLKKGERAQVIGVEYPKACMVYKIKLADGRFGYVTHGDEFREVKGPKK